MSAIEHLDSLDAKLLEARRAWEEEKKTLLDHIFTLETKTALLDGLMKQEREQSLSHQQITTKLITQFAVVAHVFDEARRLAVKAGFDLPTEATTQTAPEAVEANKALIDSATQPTAPQNASSSSQEPAHATIQANQ